MTNKQNKNKSSVNLVDAVLRLLGKNVPTLAIWESKGELVWLGSADMSKWLTDLDDDLKEDLRSKLVSDMVKLSNNEEELLANVDHVPVKTRASLIFKSLTKAKHSSGTQLLPFPLSLSNKRQKLKYISDLIRLESKEKKVKLVYGSEECKPSFWLEHLWCWKNLNGSVFTVEEKTYTGQGSWGEFLTQTIKCLLESRDLDPEKHVVDLGLKEKTLKKKKRIRGIHDCPAIIEKSIQNNVSIVEESVVVPNPMVDLMQDYHYIQDEFHPIQENPNNVIDNSEPDATPESQPLLHELQNMPVYNQQMEPNTTMKDSPGPIQDLLCTTQSLPNCQYYSQTIPLGSEEEVENSDHLGMLSAGLVEGCCCSLCLADDCHPADIAICQSGHKFCRDCLVTSTEKVLATGGDVVKCLGICDKEVEITQLRRVLGPSILSKLMGIRNEELHSESCQDEASGNQSQEDTGVHYLKPRRTVGKSPFKIPTKVPNCNARKPKVSRKELSKLQSNDCTAVARAGFLEIPGQVKGQLEGCLAQFNSGGGACLYRAAAQHCSKYCLLQIGVPVTHIELRNYANSKESCPN